MTTQAERLSKQHIGIIVACCALSMTSLGILANAYGVFYTPAAEAFGVGIGQITLQSTVVQVFTGPFCPVATILLSKMPAKRVVIIGTVLATLALVGMALTQSIAVFVALGALVGIGSAFSGFVPILSVLNNWFERNLGTYTGIAMAFAGIGGAIFSPLFTTFIEAMGVRSAYLIVAVIFAVITLVPSLLFLHNTPEEVGLTKYGANTEKAVADAEQDGGDAKLTVGMLPVMLLIVLFAMLSQGLPTLTSHFPGYATLIGASAQTGALMMSAAFAGNILSKLAFGVMSDKMGTVRTVVTFDLLPLASLLVLLFARPTNQLVLLVVAFVFGSAYAVSSVGLPLVTRLGSGPKLYSAAVGITTPFSYIGYGVMVSVIGFMYDFTGDYTLAITTCIGISLVLIALVLAIGAIAKSRGRAT